MNIKKLAGISLACAAIALNAAPTRAGLVLQLDDGVPADLKMITDGGVGDSNPLAGVITYIGDIGFWTLNVITAVSGAPSGAIGIDLNSVDRSTQAGSLTLSMWTNLNDFTSPPSGPASLLNALGGTTDGTVKLDSYINTGGPAPLPAGAPWTLGTSQAPTPVPGAFSGTTVGGVNILGAFDLGQVATITHTSRGGGLTSFNSNVQVPEPTILGLLGLGLLGFGFARRRRAA